MVRSKFLGSITPSPNPFVHPYPYMTITFFILEASSFGTLCIGTRSGGIPEAIRDGITGFIVEEHDVKKIAEIIDDLLKNPDKQRQLSAQAKQYAQETLSWDNEEKKLFQCLP